MVNITSEIIGKSVKITELKKMISIIAASNSPVLIYGQTGSGKELVAQRLHEESRRKGRFIALNCAAIPAELMEAELFGFEKGAFTGAIKSTPGKFEQAHNGTLFLDELGDMPLTLQSKILRLLETSSLTKVGSTQEQKFNTRVVCATHKDLEELVKNKQFREDLFFRLNVFPLTVPSLKERSEDVPELLEHFLNLRKKPGTQNLPIFKSDAVKMLQSYNWPGNIREMRNLVERAVTFFPGQNISKIDVENYLIRIDSSIINRAEEQKAIWDEFEELSTNKIRVEELASDNSKLPDPNDFARWFDFHNAIDLRSMLRDIEIVLIKASLNRNDNNTSEAAKDLKLLRTTLIEKIKKYGI